MSSVFCNIVYQAAACDGNLYFIFYNCYNVENARIVNVKINGNNYEDFPNTFFQCPQLENKSSAQGALEKDVMSDYEVIDGMLGENKAYFEVKGKNWNEWLSRPWKF